MTTKLKLVVRAKKGDAEAFQALIYEEKEKLYKMAFVYMRNEDDALEVFHKFQLSARYLAYPKNTD